MARDDPRCLPPTRTLRRIRWPLQPRFRDRPTAFGDVTTAGRRSHAILGLTRSFTKKFLGVKAVSPVIVSIDAAPDTLVPDGAPPRPPFTPTATLFGALRGSLFEARMLPADFCNCTYDVRATKPELPFPRRDDGHDHLPFLTHHARPTQFYVSSGDTRRAALRPFVPTPVPVPPACAGLPDRDTEPTATPLAACAARVQCRLTSTGLWTE
jgi:hypothetical protein